MEISTILMTFRPTPEQLVKCRFYLLKENNNNNKKQILLLENVLSLHINSLQIKDQRLPKENTINKAGNSLFTYASGS